MGKAEILGNLGEGKYTVRVLRDENQLNAMIARAEAMIEILTPKRDEKQAEVDAAMEEIDAEIEALKEFFAEWDAALEATLGRVENGGDYGVLRDTNVTREAEAKSQPCAYDDAIRDIGLPHSAWLASYIDTYGQDAVTLEIAHYDWSTRFQQLKDAFPYMLRAGENVAMIADFANRPWAATEGWLNSPSHRGTLLEPEYTHCAIAIHIMPDGLGVCTQIFVAMRDQDELFAEALEKKREWEAVQRSVDMMTLEIAAHEANLLRWNALLETITQDIREAWCADYSDDIESGITPTADINGEPGHVILQPTYREPYTEPAPGEQQTEFNCLPAGYMLPIAAMTPAQAAFNWAILPGWQKWRPTYRVGEIVELDTSADTCSVILDDAWSVAQQLHINQGTGRLDNVPVDYMTCNAAAFEVGDRVLVEFQNQKWEEPVVIGFEAGPKECDNKGLALYVGVYPSIGSYIPTTGILKFVRLNRDCDKIVEVYSGTPAPTYHEFWSSISMSMIRTWPWEFCYEPISDRFFFTGEMPDSFFQYYTSFGRRSDWAKHFIVGTNPGFVKEIVRYAPTGDYDSEGNEVYGPVPGEYRATYVTNIETDGEKLVVQQDPTEEADWLAAKMQWVIRDVGNADYIREVDFVIPDPGAFWAQEEYWTTLSENTMYNGMCFHVFGTYIGETDLETEVGGSVVLDATPSAYYGAYKMGTYLNGRIWMVRNQTPWTVDEDSYDYHLEAYNLETSSFDLQESIGVFTKNNWFQHMTAIEDRLYVADGHGIIKVFEIIDEPGQPLSVNLLSDVNLTDLLGDELGITSGHKVMAMRVQGY